MLVATIPKLGRRAPAGSASVRNQFKINHSKSIHNQQLVVIRACTTKPAPGKLKYGEGTPACFSPDGRMVVTVYDERAELWRAGFDDDDPMQSFVNSDREGRPCRKAALGKWQLRNWATRSAERSSRACVFSAAGPCLVFSAKQLARISIRA